MMLCQDGWKNTGQREGLGTGGHVILNFLLQVIFVFFLFLGMVTYAKEVETKREIKITCEKKLTTTHTLTEVVTKTIPITLTCVKGQALVKTEADTLAGEKAYLCLDKQNEVEAKALVYTWAHTFPQVKVKSVTNTLRDMEGERPIDTLTDAIRVDGRNTV